jgi:hypothetical protein
MKNTDTIVKGRNFGRSLVPYERLWVALDKETDAVIASDRDLEVLVAKLSPEELERAIFMPVLPHDVSFAPSSWA